MRKLLSVLFSTLQGGVRGGLLFLLFFASVSAIYASDTQVDGIWYDFDSSTMTASVTYRGDDYNSWYGEYSGSVVIPETVTYDGTTYSVTSIGDWAFAYCESLISITIGNSVTSIEIYAFSSCSSLTSVTIGESVTSIENYAFVGCSSLTSITIPNSVTSIGGSAFAYCTSLTSVTIPESVTSIGDQAFSHCSSLTSITIPNSVTSIGKSAFYNCSSLTSITIPNSVTSIGESAFERCSVLTSIIIPNSVTSIGDRAFYDCSALTSITIPNSVTSIGDYAFYDCSALTSITIPNSVTSIGECAFWGCNSITSIVVNEDNTIYDSRENCNAIIETITNTLILGCQNTIIPNSVISIGDGAFSDCSSLTSIAIPNSVTSIGRYVFSGCSALTSIAIPNSVTSIGYSAFSGCSSLTSITIPNSVTSIGDYAFYDCSALTSITIPNSVTGIGNSAFRACSSLTSIAIPNSVTSIGDWAFSSCYSLTSITIPNSVTNMGDYAFRGCSLLISPIYNANCFAYMPTSYSGFYEIPKGIKQIAGGAFSHCSSLISIAIPNSVTSIGDGAFSSCSSLTSITCEAETPPTVGSDAFYKVSKSIPVYVPCGSENAYKAASGWKDFTNIQEPQAEYTIQVSISNSQRGTAKVDYNNCAGSQIIATANHGYQFVQWSDGNTDNPRTLILTQDTILTAEFAQSYSGQCGDNLYWSYDEATKTISITGSGDMYDYTANTQPWVLFKEQILKVTTSNDATSIGTSAFEGCIRLGKVTLGSSIQNIAAKAFAGCTRLYDVYCYATYPPFADATSFANYNAYLYVPCENQRDYTLDMVWGNFKHIECIESEDVFTNGVVITPSTNDVTITWPTEGNADTYTIVIKKGNEVFCTLTFNANGQLLNIAFAPGRDGNHPVQYAEQAGNGYRFTVTGLEEGTHYAYNIDVRDAANKTIKSHTGEFTTESLTAVENITTNNANIQKILRNGQLLILRDGVEYTIMGQEL